MQRAQGPAARLRQAREAKGLSCRQLADITKLSVRTIEALENDRISSLPEGIYRRSIVRALASEVGLNPDQLLREFAAAHPDDLPAPASAAVVAAAEPSLSFQKMIALAGAVLPLLAGAAYFGWPAAGGIQLPSKGEPAPATAARRDEIVPAGGFAEAAALPRPVVVTLTVSSRCELRLIADGRDVLDRLVAQGETVQIELGEELWLLGDNASAVQFSINGQAGRLLGAPGEALSVRIGRDDYDDFLVRY